MELFTIWLHKYLWPQPGKELLIFFFFVITLCIYAPCEACTAKNNNYWQYCKAWNKSFLLCKHVASDTLPTDLQHWSIQCEAVLTLWLKSSHNSACLTILASTLTDLFADTPFVIKVFADLLLNCYANDAPPQTTILLSLLNHQDIVIFYTPSTNVSLYQIQSYYLTFIRHIQAALGRKQSKLRSPIASWIRSSDHPNNYATIEISILGHHSQTKILYMAFVHPELRTSSLRSAIKTGFKIIFYSSVYCTH